MTFFGSAPCGALATGRRGKCGVAGCAVCYPEEGETDGILLKRLWGIPDDAEAVEASVTERDPTGRARGEAGSKLDAGKAPVWRGVIGYFPRALLAVAEVSGFGAEKYMWRGWESVPDGINRYGDALARHLVKEHIEGPCDSDSGLLHAAHAAWGALARLELILRGKEAEA